MDELDEIPFDPRDIEQDSIKQYFLDLEGNAAVYMDASKPLKWYVRSAEVVYKQACIYRNEDDYEKAYILYLKFSNLVLKQMPAHAEYNSRELLQLIRVLRQLCVKALTQLETLKVILRQKRKGHLEHDKKPAPTVAPQKEPAFGEGCDSETTWLERYRKIQEFSRLNANDQLVRPIVSPKDLRIRPADVAPRHVLTSAENDTDASVAPAPPKWFAENGAALRKVSIPSRIIGDFMDLSKENTNKSIETCAVFAGKLSHDEFTVTTLIVPKQKGTSDTCAMYNEEEIVDVQDREDVMTLGWIHTHPTQDCFLSSVDVHTQFPFQLLMAEAVAIVCSPQRRPNYGVFRLTDPPGIGVISKCKIAAPFHPHPDVEIYKNITFADAHARLADGLPLRIIDLR